VTLQTKQQIERLLASCGLTPNKRRGQNFLIDLNLMRLLIDTAHLNDTDTVLEVGCGTGSLTEGLAERAGKVVVAEIEDALYNIAKAQLDEAYNVEFFNVDILENKNTIDTQVLQALTGAQQELGGRLLLVANLPYSVASPVMINLVTGPVTADEMYVTVQKEVADRMTARPDSADYGTLTILLGATGEVKLIRTLRPTCFWPAPQIDSAMISFVRDSEKVARIHNMDILGEVVALFMQHRRKMLQACAKLAQPPLDQIHNWAAIFEEAFTDPRLRPEQITPENYISIANLCAAQIS
jgi:16S rRNA (adenine1518-N6/adenine1519-N6)-dimethyltransferase